MAQRIFVVLALRVGSGMCHDSCCRTRPVAVPTRAFRAFIARQRDVVVRLKSKGGVPGVPDSGVPDP